MAKKRVTPHLSHTFLHRQGIKIMPSQNFIDKFKEEYTKLFYRSKARQHIKLDDDALLYFIIAYFEAIIYCIDCNVDVFLYHTVVAKSRISDYVSNIKYRKKAINENVKKVTFRLYSSYRLRMVKNVNKDNKEYEEYLKRKKEKYKEIKRYYKEFYSKEDEWWLYD